jgi:hypothetical protein
MPWMDTHFTFFLIKPTTCANFTNLFWYETLHVSDSSSVHHQVFIYCTLSNRVCHTGLKTAFEQDQLLLVLLETCLQTCMTYTIAECTVNKLLIIDSGTVRTSIVSCQYKFVKLVHPLGYIKKKFVRMHCHMNAKKYTWVSMKTTVVSGVYHLLSMCHIYMDVGIKFSASYCLIYYFMDVLCNRILIYIHLWSVRIGRFFVLKEQFCWWCFIAVNC